MLHAPNLTKVLDSAALICKTENQPLTTTQLFGEIIREFKIGKVLESLGISSQILLSSMIASIGSAFPELLEEPKASEELNKTLAAAESFANEGLLDVEHVLLAILKDSTVSSWLRFLDNPPFPIDELTKEIKNLINFSPKNHEDSDDDDEEDAPPNMMRYCENLSAEAMQSGQTIYGREKEISEILDTLVRAKKNNVLLIGENGVGRKSICRGVAERILSGRASEFIHTKNLWKLDVTKLSSGSGMYGVLESKVSSLAA